MKPTPEFQAHHELEAPAIDERAFRQGWRVRRRLDALLADGSLTAGEWQAAEAFRTLWSKAFAMTGPREPGASGHRNADARQVALLDIAARTLDIERRIGPLAFSLVYLCAVEDQTWAEIGRRVRRDPHRAKAYTVLAIRALAAAPEPARAVLAVSPP